MRESVSKWGLLVGVVLVAAASRLLPHPFNFAPLGAMALFGSAYLHQRGLGLLLTMAAWWLSDLVLNNVVYPQQADFVLFTDSAFFIYISIAAIYFMGRFLLSSISAGRVVAGSLVASVLFFVLSNLGVWFQNTLYPLTAAGFVECYAQALPFFPNTIAGDLVYSAALFAAYRWAYAKGLVPERQ